MGTISSGIGLISGLDTQSIIDQLIQIEARPRQLVEQQVQVLSSQKTGFLDVNARLLSLQTSADAFVKSDSFAAKRAASSNPDVLSATADADAPQGTYQFTVDRLVSSHQMITRGFTDAATTAFGTDTSIRVESAQGRLDREVELAELNGFAGVSRGKIRITDRSGATAEVDLSRAVTLDDVVSQINNAGGIAVTAGVQGDRLAITDNTGSTANDLLIANVGSTGTATSLGIAGNSAGGDAITGTQINRLAEASPLTALNDGHGVRALGGGQDDLSIDDGTSNFNVSLDAADSVKDVLDAINNASGNTSVTASIGGDGVSITLSGAGGFTVAALNGSTAAADLGLEGSGGATYSGERILAAMGSKLIRNLSGTTAVAAGEVTFDTGSGPQSVDLSAARSFSDAIDTINAAGAGVTAALNRAGNGIAITADNGAALSIADATGNLAATFGLAGSFADGAADSGDLDFAYISAGTRLDALNGGRGVASGRFTLTDSAGVTASVDLTQGEATLGQVIAEINSRPTGITASINDTGDGLLLTDTAGGALDMKVEEDGDTTAADLGILGTAGGGVIDGAFEKAVEIEATDTLQDIADKLNAADVGLSTTVINDGSGSAPFRLSLSADASGRAGRVLIDDGGLDLRTDTLVEGRDAVVFFGSADPAQAVLLTSSANSLNDTIAGVSIDLNGTSNSATSLTISRDTGSIVDAVQKFVDDFNGVMDRISALDSFDAEEEERGLLLGDPTLAAVRRRLLDAATQEYSDVSGQYTRLFQVGVRVGADSKLTFDENRLREAISTDLDAVTELFSLKAESAGSEQQIAPGVTVPASGSNVTARGVGATLEQLLKGLTDSIDGTLTNATNRIDAQIELSNNRIEQLNTLLAGKRQRLERQFATMETTLAQLQDQQSALASLSQIAFNAGQ